jgi:type VI secretion system protein ImpB
MSDRIAERVNLQYSPATDGQKEQRELPLRLLVVGDFTDGKNPVSKLSDREAVAVNSENLNSVLKAQNLTIDMSVKNRLSGDPDEQLGVKLKIQTMQDFNPDRIVEQVEPLRQLRDLRVVLEKLKQQYINEEDFRAALRAILKDPERTRLVLDELKMRGQGT